MKQLHIPLGENTTERLDDNFLRSLLAQAQELNAQLAKLQPSLPSKSNDGPERLASFAKRLHLLREQRRRHLDADLLGEPMWDILLDLYAQEGAGREVSVTSCCLAAGVPATTALRWIGVLENRDLIARRNDHNDGRRHHLYLTTKGRTVLESVLREMYLALRS